MIPKPPFADDLTRDQELAHFDRLKPRLHQVWDVISAQEDLPATSIVVPSFTLDQEELTKLDGAAFYEERLLFLLIRLRNPRAHVTYVTSQPVHPLILDYYLHLLAGVPASHARARLTLLCAYDSSPRPLTQKILERPRLIERIRQSIPNSEAAYLTVFNSTPLERKLSVLRLLEDRTQLIDLLPPSLGDGEVHVAIGSEHRMEPLRGCSLVFGRYGTGTAYLGYVGVVGPTRMDYARTIGAVRYVGSLMSDLVRVMEGH